MVAYATADGTATTADSDYQRASGTLTFAPGVTTQTITVPVNGDTKIEADETFAVALSGPTNAIIARGTGTGTIVIDDRVTVTAVNPSGGPVGGGATVTITGTGFAAGASVTFGTMGATVTNVTPTTITVTTPAHGVGVVDVTVTVNGVGATKAGAYTYFVDAPVPGSRVTATPAPSIATVAAPTSRASGPSSGVPPALPPPLPPSR